MNEQIFISYRRDGGDVTAKLICEALKNNGYTVFYDYDSINGGFFDQRIFEGIQSCNDFILVLSKNALDRCVNEDDWVRQEIAYALKQNKHIVPVMLEDFKFPDNLPSEIEDISRINAVHFIMSYFEGVISAIKDRLISKPIAPPMPPDSFSKNLAFSFEEDLNGYSVAIGKCTDTEIRIPESYNTKAVVAIAENGFKDCSAIKSVVLPETIKSIGESAFYQCSSLKKINIPSNVTDIGKWAFFECSSIQSASIPKNVKSIGLRAFSKCTSLSSFKVDPDNRFFCDVDQNLYTKDMRTFVAYACGKNEQSYAVREGVIKIGESAFSRAASLSTISLPNSVTQIEKFAFIECTALEEIALPDCATNIESYAFKLCTSLLSITIPKGIQAIEEDTFRDCSSLKTVVLPETLTSIGDSAFSRCALLENINIPSSVTDIGKWAFYKCACIKSVSIPQGVKYIEENAFRECSALKTVVLPETLKSIGESAFDRCSSLKNITIPSNVTNIGKWAFYKCSCIKNVSIPKNVKSIGTRAFTDCTSLLSFEVDPDNGYFCDIDENLYTKNMSTFVAYACGKNETSYAVHEGVKKIEDCAFSSAASLSSISLPNSVTQIEKFAFIDCTSLEVITLPDCATSIGSSAFKRCSSLISITVPKGIQAIEEETFRDCSALKTVVLPKTLKSIGEGVFNGCAALENITIPSNVTDIGKWAFSGCSGIKSISIPKNVKNIGARAFLNCSSLKKFEVSFFNRSYCYKQNALFTKDMKLLHTYALGLPDTDYIIPSGVTSIEDSAFSHSNLKSVTIPYTITSIGEFSFHKCKNLKTINYNGIISMFKKISLNSNSFDKAKQVRCNDGTTDI